MIVVTYNALTQETQAKFWIFSKPQLKHSLLSHPLVLFRVNGHLRRTIPIISNCLKGGLITFHPFQLNGFTALAIPVERLYIDSRLLVKVVEIKNFRNTRSLTRVLFCSRLETFFQNTFRKKAIPLSKVKVQYISHRIFSFGGCLFSAIGTTINFI